MTLTFLSSPYTDFEDGREAAYHEVARVAARLMSEGHHIVSPIVHGHALTTVGRLGDRPHDWWMERCRPLAERCDQCLVAMLPGWRTSKGVAIEIGWFREWGRPVRFVYPLTLGICEEGEV